jgi:hypothetical protein
MIVVTGLLYLIDLFFHIREYNMYSLNMKKCLYCEDFIDTSIDDYEKIGRKYVCVLCYDEYYNEFCDMLEVNESEEDFSDY